MKVATKYNSESSYSVTSNRDDSDIARLQDLLYHHQPRITSSATNQDHCWNEISQWDEGSCTPDDSFPFQLIPNETLGRDLSCLNFSLRRC
jgi:hypothetical protein